MEDRFKAPTASHWPSIIQGGMGAGVSDWRLARAVAKAGQMGVISGTALDTILIRRLQDGDPDGAMRRALGAFPYREMAERILNEWYTEGGKAPDAPYRLKPLPEVEMGRLDEELMIVANFAEVYLAKEGHDGWVGINLLEKIQLPTLPSLFGAMLAGVDVVIMGGGIPLAIPGVLDEMAQLRPVALKLHVVGADRSHEHKVEFHPGTHVPASQDRLKRPCFFPVVSSETLAKTLVRKASGRVDGLIVEHYSAGGHNAPPRRDGAYSDRDVCSLEKIAALSLPFWLAGGCASPESLQAARSTGAEGVQVGSAFACSKESGIATSIKNEIIEQYRSGRIKVITDFRASPTDYPFKRLELKANKGADACRVCDLGYLRHIFEKEDGTLGYRCPAAPKKNYVLKGGRPEDCEGRRCLCNGLLATIGLGQIRRGRSVLPLVTIGDDLSFLDRLGGGASALPTAGDVIEYLLSSPESGRAPN
ncbi:2-nitropropane dioxygenase [Coraliomargarita sinensis]|uniref:2-nitropropane dioxygenase n=1 Tax=Coraliomargarita sinensis TaxID=2174842 RepID=A0A317ZGZ6_9BACT|nr:nitronate monooxygenase [Coraliomargarita sinensis]PXA04875.1 2-nitropropane dioxygenase [Coraliomargarita sinensis]